MPRMSEKFQNNKPSSIRIAGILCDQRTDGVAPINVAIGNVSLKMPKKMLDRMFDLQSEDSPFRAGVVGYTPTKGTPECNAALMNILKSSGFETRKLYSQITGGGSDAMELIIVGVCGKPGTSDDPLLLIDPAYTNYVGFANRLGRKIVSFSRTLSDSGKFTLPKNSDIEEIIRAEKPNALVVIPYDNPTGQYFDQKRMNSLAKLCVKYDMWMISDEAYRELFYGSINDTSSIWAISESVVPGITGRRISIETASKVWNACGLRIGGIITDNKEFHEACVAEQTVSLCASAIGQYIFAALASESPAALQGWYKDQRELYQNLLVKTTGGLKKELPGIIVSSPDASIYSVIDVRNIVKPGFDSNDFMKYCATKGKVDVDGKLMTLLTAPMGGFYNVASGQPNPGKTQVRIAYVETAERMALVPPLFAALLNQYEAQR